MPFQGHYIFTASMDVTADKEDLFNEVYDTEHVPLLNKVPGVISIARFKTQELVLAIGGERRTIFLESEPRYSAIYEVESADVMSSDAWMEASEAGRWAEEVRPFTSNKRHTLHRLRAPGQ
jgi:hypothetical protein